MACCPYECLLQGWPDNMAALISKWWQSPCPSIKNSILAITSIENEYIFTLLSQFTWLSIDLHTWFKWQYIQEYVYTLYVHIVKPLLWAKLLFLCFVLFYFVALWYIYLKGIIFFKNKGFDEYSCVCEMKSIFPEESCTVKTSLVVTHSIFIVNSLLPRWILLT